MKYSKTGYRRNSKDRKNPFNIIPSNRISMKNVDIPLFAISDTGDTRIMFPNEEHLFGGTRVVEIPMKKKGGKCFECGGTKMQVGGETTDLRYPIYNEKTLNLLDEKIRSQCGTDKGCLAAARQGFDLTAASLFGLPKMSDIFEQRGITSFKEGDEAKMTEEKKKQLLQTGYLNPYNPKEKGYNSLDSWEFAKYLADTDGKVYFKPSKEKQGLHVRVDDDANYIKSLNLPIGTWIGFGPTDPNQGYFPNSPSVKAGFGAQNHSAQVIGYDEDGQIVLSDYGQARTLKQAMQDNITTIITPKEYIGKDFNYYKNLRDQEQAGVNFKPNYSVSPELKSEIGYDEDEMAPFLESLSKNKERIVKRLGIKPDQYDNIAKRLIALSGLESEFGTGWTHNAENTIAPSGNSLGLSQLKWENISKDEQLSKLAEELGVVREEDLTDPKKFAVAAMLYGWKHNAYANAAYKKGMEPSHRYYSRNEEDLKNVLRDPNWEKGSIGRDVLRNIVGNETFKMPRRWFGNDEQYAERVNKKLKEDPVLGPAGVRYEKLLERKKNETDPDVSNYYIVKPTAGNSPDLTEDQIFFTGWQGYNSLKSGDTQSVNGVPLNFYTKKADKILKGIESKQKGGIIKSLFGGNSGDIIEQKLMRMQLGGENDFTPLSMTNMVTSASGPSISQEKLNPSYLGQFKPMFVTDSLTREKSMIDPNNLYQPKTSSGLGIPPSYVNAVVGAFGKRRAQLRQEQQIQDQLANPFNSIPIVTKENKFLNEGMTVKQEGGEVGEDYEDEEFLFAEDEQEQQQPIQTQEEEIEEQQQPEEEEDYFSILSLDDDDDEQEELETNETNYNSSTSYKESSSTNPSSIAPVVPPISPSSENEVANEDEVYNYLISKGLPEHVAAGIVGNLIQESSLNLNALGDKGTAYGLAQWRGDRLRNLKDRSLKGQLDYLLLEAEQRGDLQRLLNSRTPEDAAYLFAKHYERPKTIDQSRINNARRLYNKFKK